AYARTKPNPNIFCCSIHCRAFMHGHATFWFTNATTAEALTRFKKTLQLGNESATLSSWNPNKDPCNGNKVNWVGVLCFNGNVRGLQLENLGLQGKLDLEPLTQLPYLKTLSFMNNSLAGPLPELKNLKLRSVYLSYNHFSGKIPSSLTTLPKIFDVGLEENKFSGQIPDFRQKGLKRLNLANNELEGPVPESLSKLDPSSFSGNGKLCGPPLAGKCSDPPPPASPPSPSAPPSECSGTHAAPLRSHRRV
ncbi:hypothetical protein Prudu_008161, partial [Prunus dulcis]